jgi:hypothetical protein
MTQSLNIYWKDLTDENEISLNTDDSFTQYYYFIFIFIIFYYFIYIFIQYYIIIILLYY